MDDEYDDEFAEQAALSFLELFGATTKPKNRRFRPIDALVLGFYAAHGFSDAMTNTLAAAYNQLASHANLGRDMEDMQEDATREIESLITGEDQ